MTNTAPPDGRLFVEPDADETAEEAAAHAPAAEEPAAEAAPEAEAVSDDIGNWKYTPWKGRPMWTNALSSGWTSFDRTYVRKHRHMSAEPAKR